LIFFKKTQKKRIFKIKVINFILNREKLKRGKEKEI